jgi:hypothetical protein
MIKLKIVVFVLVAVFLTVSAVSTSEAQRNRGKRAVKRDVRVTRTVHRKVVVRKAHVRYAHLPRWRSVVAVAPAGSVVIRTRKVAYHYHNGIFYTPASKGFVIVRPVRGVRVKVLPVGYRKIVVGPRPYFYYYGTFYAQVDNSDEYETVDAPEGAVVDALPVGYEVRNIDGTEYYVLDDVYYAEVESTEFDDGIGYEVVDL